MKEVLPVPVQTLETWCIWHYIWIMNYKQISMLHILRDSEAGRGYGAEREEGRRQWCKQGFSLRAESWHVVLSLFLYTLNLMSQFNIKMTLKPVRYFIALVKLLGDKLVPLCPVCSRVAQRSYPVTHAPKA